MSLDKDDIRAAVASNILTEPQATSLMALADSRRGTRENMDGLDEPFELFLLRECGCIHSLQMFLLFSLLVEK